MSWDDETNKFGYTLAANHEGHDFIFSDFNGNWSEEDYLPRDQYPFRALIPTSTSIRDNWLRMRNVLERFPAEKWSFMLMYKERTTGKGIDIGMPIFFGYTLFCTNEELLLTLKMIWEH